MIAAALLMAASAAGAAAEEPQQNCAEPITQLDMNICAGADLRAADERLNAQWRMTADAMRARDRATAGLEDGRSGYFDQLLEAQHAWLRFRDAHCASVGYGARGGSMEPMLIAMCKTTLTSERTRQLKELGEEQP